MRATIRSSVAPLRCHQVTAVPAEHFTISFHIDYEDPKIGIQSATFQIHPSTYREEIAPARTFAMMKDVANLQEMGLVKGGSFENACVFEDGTLAGSSIGMIDAVKYLVRSGLVELDEALRMASLYPAAALGVEDRYGRIKPGYRANLLALDEDLSVARSFIDGELERFG